MISIQRGCHDTKNNDIQYNDIQHNDTRHNDIQHNNTQHEHLVSICCGQYVQCVVFIMLSAVMPSVVTLNVVARTKRPSHN